MYAGTQLIELLLWFQMSNRLSAKYICIIAFWAFHSKGMGGLDKLSKKPNSPSGHFQRHLDAFLEADKEADRQGKLSVPCYAKHSAERIVREVAVAHPHEEFNNEVLVYSEAHGQLREAQQTGVLPDGYWGHVGIKDRSADGAFPLAVYVDGMPYRKKDGIIAWVVINLVTGCRHLICILRKGELCRCGCKGWCSMWVVWRWIRWSLEALFDGRFPSRPAPCLAWTEEQDSWGGLHLALRGVVLYIKSDLMDRSTSFAFPTWNSVNHPCTDCWADRDTIYRPQPAGSLELQFRETTHEEYERACARAEVKVVVHEWQTFLYLRSSLGLDGRIKAGKGRHMKRDMPALGLLSGDRLEPSDALRCFS